MKPITVLIIIIACLIVCCRKDSFISDSNAVVNISADTIHFDTLFTSTGSVTHFFKVFNENDRKLRIADITLSGGSNSFFKINTDGAEGPSVTGLEIEPNDSLYVFVTVRVDPGTDNLPFIVQDSIGITYNGVRKWVQLQAWGQNANFMNSKVITADTTWANDKPFVILGGLLIAYGAKLTIQEGTKLYFHADAPFIVDGTLDATGDKYDSTKIVLRGDRIDDYYRDLPASWPGIYFRETSTDNFLKHVVVKNAYQGLISEKPSSIPGFKVTLEECIIDNCFDAGILGVNSSITAVNCLVSNCGKNILLVQGGTYDFKQCTDVAISNSFISHRQPVLVVTDFLKNGNVITVADTKASFINCIFWGANGTVENEVVTVREGQGVFEVDFKNCLWKVKDQPAGVSMSGMVENQDPSFQRTDTRENNYDFTLKEGSTAINAGLNAGISTDLNGDNRVNIPDIGAYETTF
ncbi:MAG TPA: choice-of-anchor Q domain-containing protein [Flavitalea sp.]|nr:choice-of-anchor Q domain-containing protein [Flavitalea sp.]